MIDEIGDYYALHLCLCLHRGVDGFDVMNAWSMSLLMRLGYANLSRRDGRRCLLHRVDVSGDGGVPFSFRARKMWMGY